MDTGHLVEAARQSGPVPEGQREHAAPGVELDAAARTSSGAPPDAIPRRLAAVASRGLPKACRPKLVLMGRTAGSPRVRALSVLASNPRLAPGQGSGEKLSRTACHTRLLSSSASNGARGPPRGGQSRCATMRATALGSAAHDAR